MIFPRKPESPAWNLDKHMLETYAKMSIKMNMSYDESVKAARHSALGNMPSDMAHAARLASMQPNPETNEMSKTNATIFCPADLTGWNVTINASGQITLLSRQSNEAGVVQIFPDNGDLYLATRNINCEVMAHKFKTGSINTAIELTDAFVKAEYGGWMGSTGNEVEAVGRRRVGLRQSC